MNSYSDARRNGMQGEKDAQKILGLQADTNALLDILVNDSAIEIKACRTVVGDNSFAKGWRWGRFGFSGPQHAEMVVKDGIYLFMLYDVDSRLIHAQMVAANVVESRCTIKRSGKTMVQWARILSSKTHVAKRWRGCEDTMLELFGYR